MAVSSLVVPVAIASAQDQGAAVFAAQRCSLCHSLDGKGHVKGPLHGVGAKVSAEDTRKWTVTPAAMAVAAQPTRKPAMWAFPKFPKDDLDALVAFVAAGKKA